jgi:hypothetical protein
MLMLDRDVRWLLDTEPPFPRRDDSVGWAGSGVGTALPPNGTFTPPKLFRVELNEPQLKIWSETGLDQVLTYVRALDAAVTPDTPHLFRDAAGKDVTVKLPGATHGTIRLPDKTLVSAHPYPDVAATAQSFGDVFATEAESPFDKAPFVGWDPAWVNPRHLQGTEPLRQNIFAYPDDSSHAYHRSEWGKQKIVPNGALFVSDVQSSGSTCTRFASSEREIQSTWKHSVGGKVGVGEFSFQASKEFRDSLKQNLSLAQSCTISVVTLQSHILFVDLPRVTLDDDFVDAVNRLAASSTAAELNKFIAVFGTHYAYAITYGARAFNEMYFSKAATAEAASKGTTTAIEAAAGYGPFKASVSASDSLDQSSQLGQEIRAQQDKYTTEGGDASSGGHLSLGNSPVPILLDLRPITDLLNPTFFDNPAVHSGLRPKLDAAVQAYFRGLPDAFNEAFHVYPVIRIRVTYLTTHHLTGEDMNANGLLIRCHAIRAGCANLNTA